MVDLSWCLDALKRKHYSKPNNKSDLFSGIELASKAVLTLIGRKMSLNGGAALPFPVGR